MAGASKPKASNGGGGGGEEHHFVPGDIVLGKIKGYPPWPGVLCSEENVPKRNVLSARPGKNYHIVRFFPAADYGFNRPHELRRLTKREIEAFLSDPHKRAAELREAYKLALDPEAWNEEQNAAVREAEEAGENEDMLAEEEDEEEQPVKKRKTTSLSAGQKASSTSKKSKVDPSTSTSAAAKDRRPTSSNSAVRKDSADVEGGMDDMELDPETKKVKGWRHTLQRGFLPKDGNINPDDMEQHDRTFNQVEEYDDITVAQLRLTKIGKVMKRITQLSNIPADDKFHFRERAQKLCDVWGEVLSGGAKPSVKDEASAAAASASAGTNGPSNGSAASQAAVAQSSSQTDSSKVKEDEQSEQGSKAAPEADESVLTQPPNDTGA